MTNHSSLSTKPQRFHALTGYTLEEFAALLPAFSQCFHAQMQEFTLNGKPRQKRDYVGYCSSPLPPMADKLLFILMYLRKATTQDIFGESFGMSQPIVNQWVHHKLPRQSHGNVLWIAQLPVALSALELLLKHHINRDNVLCLFPAAWRKI